MHIAVLKKQHEVVTYLMERCPDMIAFEDSSGQNALHYAITHKQNYMVRQFAAHSPALIDKTNTDAKSPIEHAIRSNYFGGVVAMLSHKPEVPNVFVTSDTHDTLLHLF